jgi:cytochrome c-type biogenesis protein CcmH/NrfG
MGSKDFFTNPCLPALLLALSVPALIFGCASRQAIPQPGKPSEEAVQSTPDSERIAPQQAAAEELIDRGRRHLANVRPDAAIRDLERAMSLNPSDGQTYYYLAEAWLMKIDARRAGVYNRMAENHFKDDPDWLVRIARQADRIAELEK